MLLETKAKKEVKTVSQGLVHRMQPPRRTVALERSTGRGNQLPTASFPTLRPHGLAAVPPSPRRREVGPLTRVLARLGDLLRPRRAPLIPLLPEGGTLEGAGRQRRLRAAVQPLGAKAHRFELHRPSSFRDPAGPRNAA